MTYTDESACCGREARRWIWGLVVNGCVNSQNAKCKLRIISINTFMSYKHEINQSHGVQCSECKSSEHMFVHRAKFVSLPRTQCCTTASCWRIKITTSWMAQNYHESVTYYYLKKYNPTHKFSDHDRDMIEATCVCSFRWLITFCLKQIKNSCSIRNMEYNSYLITRC